MKILHCFADYGIESEALGAYGDVYRVGLDPVDTNDSVPIKANAKNLPFEKDSFDIGLFHPPCAWASKVTGISGDRENHENLVPLARELGNKYCDHYIIENVPDAIKDGGLDEDSVILSGLQFGIPLRFERAFECSFPVEEGLPELREGQELSPYFSADRSYHFWKSLKGYSGDYPKNMIARNCVPSPFIHYLMRQFLREENPRDSQVARSSHNNPKPEKLATDRFTKKGRSRVSKKSKTNGKAKQEAVEEICRYLDIEAPEKSYLSKAKLQEMAKALPEGITQG